KNMSATRVNSTIALPLCLLSTRLPWSIGLGIVRPYSPLLRPQDCRSAQVNGMGNPGIVPQRPEGLARDDLNIDLAGASTGRGTSSQSGQRDAICRALTEAGGGHRKRARINIILRRCYGRRLHAGRVLGFPVTLGAILRAG